MGNLNIKEKSYHRRLNFKIAEESCEIAEQNANCRVKVLTQL